MNHEQTSIVVNGEQREIKAGTSVVKLLQSFDLEPDRVAVELNREILKRESWAGRLLESGDQLEIVQFVGGG